MSLLTPVVIVVFSVRGPDTNLPLFLDRNLDWDIMTLLLVFLGAVLLGHLLAVRDGVLAAVLLGHLVALGDVDVVALLLRHFVALLPVVVAGLALFPVRGVAFLQEMCGNKDEYYVAHAT